MIIPINFHNLFKQMTSPSLHWTAAASHIDIKAAESMLSCLTNPTYGTHCCRSGRRPPALPEVLNAKEIIVEASSWMSRSRICLSDRPAPPAQARPQLQVCTPSCHCSSCQPETSWVELHRRAMARAMFPPFLQNPGVRRRLNFDTYSVVQGPSKLSGQLICWMLKLKG